MDYDEFGQPIYAAARRARAPRIPRGLGAAGGLAGAGGAGAAGGITAAGAVGAAAAGVAAFFLTRALQKYIGRRGLAAEQAGVQAALAFRQARADMSDALRRPLTQTEVRTLGREYKNGLRALGYDPVTFTRVRSRASRFFTSGLGED